MKIETNGNVVECGCSTNRRDLRVSLPAKTFYVYILNMTADQGNWPKFMIVPCVSCAPACIIYARGDKPHRP